MKTCILALPVVWALALPSAASPDLECQGGSQVEIGTCVEAMLERVDAAVATAFGFARGSAAELDEITGRAVAVPALEAAQTAWGAYRAAQCDFVGTTFGGGSGTGIAIAGCRVELGRARVTELMKYAR